LTQAVVKSCNVEFLFIIIRHRGNNETHLPTIRDAQKADPRFQGPHENRGWSGGNPGSARQRTGSPRSAVTYRIPGAVLFVFLKLIACIRQKNFPRSSGSGVPKAVNYFRFSLNPTVYCIPDWD
jgi:hypothetical protein